MFNFDPLYILHHSQNKRKLRAFLLLSVATETKAVVSDVGELVSFAYFCSSELRF